MTVDRRLGLVVALLGATGLMLTASLAGATHPRPKGATPLRVPLVPVLERCTAPNRMHGPPLASPSCNPPAQASDFVTVGSPDLNGAAANSRGSIKVVVHVGAPGPPNDSEVIFTAAVSDVRCSAGTSTCGNPNAMGGPDYTGELEGNAMIRITDHFNAVEAGGGTDPATVVEIPFPMNLNCVGTADPSIGASCTGSSYCPLPQGCGPRDGDRTVVALSKLEVFDGGPDGLVATEDNTLFMSQGLFVP